jgi:peptidoglycan/LPS O-acetylase OafA/YrhL
MYWSHVVIINMLISSGLFSYFWLKPVSLILLFAGVVLPLTTGISYLTYRLVEEPFLGIRRRYTDARDPT